MAESSDNLWKWWHGELMEKTAYSMKRNGTSTVPCGVPILHCKVGDQGGRLTSTGACRACGVPLLTEDICTQRARKKETN